MRSVKTTDDLDTEPWPIGLLYCRKKRESRNGLQTAPAQDESAVHLLRLILEPVGQSHTSMLATPLHQDS